LKTVACRLSTTPTCVFTPRFDIGVPVRVRAPLGQHPYSRNHWPRPITLHLCDIVCTARLERSECHVRREFGKFPCKFLMRLWSWLW
jgi:hypothetical protein